MLKTVAAAAFAGSLFFLLYGATGPPLRGGVRLVRFTNEGREPIVELHVSAVGSENWQGDLLGWSYLLPGNSVLLDIDGRNENCRIDVKIVFDDGSERVSRSMDVCRAEGWAVSLR
jgi:hypothetical protein